MTLLAWYALANANGDSGFSSQLPGLLVAASLAGVGGWILSTMQNSRQVVHDLARVEARADELHEDMDEIKTSLTEIGKIAGQVLEHRVRIEHLERHVHDRGDR